jgi:transcription termination/antitermination protein NusG
MNQFIEEKINNLYEYKWYILQTYNSLKARTNFVNDERIREKKLHEILKARNLDEYVQEIFIPALEKKDLYTQELKSINLAPGYIFIHMYLVEEIKELIKFSKIGILMGGYQNPHIVQESEIQNLKETIELKKNLNANFYIGEVVKIINKDFSDFNGIINELFVEEKTANVSISIFGRQTLIKFPFTDLEKYTNING